MWASAAKWIAKFDEGVVNAVDAEGYPLSVRQTSLPYDAATGRLRVVIPESLGAQEGRASLLCHSHDEKLWDLRSILLHGRLERENGARVFVTTSFTPPSVLQMLKNVRKAATKYLADRGLPTPKVNYDAVARLWEKAARIENP